MKFSLNIITALLSIAGAVVQAAPGKVSYDGTQVVRIDLGEDPAQVAQVSKLVADLGLAQWTDVIKAGTHVDLEVPKAKKSAFKKASKGLSYSVMHEDLGASIAAENAPSEDGGFSIAADSTFFNNYHPYAEHLTFMNELVAQYPSNAETITAGTSYQGRPITGIHIFGSAGKGKKPAIIFHGTVHAREWITGMTNQYFSWYLLSNYATNAAIKAYVDKYDFYIFPVVNPDGFIYTQTTQRLWRKNRQPTSGSSCLGHDINRNWPWKWEVTGGASTDPCSETFKGVTAGDTPEYKGLSAFQNALKATAPGVKMYIDWHSYSQLFLTPYGYSCTALPADNTELVALARGSSAAIRAVYGTSYTAGPICSTIYKATGGSVDYTYDVTKVKYSFTLELRDTGNYGFVLPATQIRPTAVETWAGLKYLLDNIV